ncbi:MAG: glucose-6-phosphate dehydrogenase [Gemmatimonadota bacterium]|nr:MAG: glucose-6-phosphate dehydrogenase [Gemmatimonadota bacterium]
MSQTHLTTEPAVIIIFGASGDLTQRKLVPALHTLACDGLLPMQSRIVGVARTDLSDQDFRHNLFEGVKAYARRRPGTCELWPRSAERHTYVAGSYDDPETYRRLAERLRQLDEEAGTRGNRLFCLATPPVLYPIIIEQLGKAELNKSGTGWTRIIIEKPFGNDFESARQLNGQVHAVFEEHQVFRIDHYLGKETAQNILFFRFANTIFEPVWNRKYIDNIQITVAETVGVGHRAGYYDKVGVLRDMFQNHLLQLMALTAMESPASFNADAIRNEKVKMFSAIRHISSGDVLECTVRGQYRGYRETEEIEPHSQTATYGALELFIDNWRWQGVPFYLRSGKMLTNKTSEIIVQFQRPPHFMFPLPPGREITPNVLALSIQPDEGMHLCFEVKTPNTLAETRSVDMEFHYADAFGADALPDAYERLLLDAIKGDASLFTRSDGIELAWQLIDPIVQVWESSKSPPLAIYEPGSWGPPEAEDLLNKTGRKWLSVHGEHGIDV